MAIKINVPGIGEVEVEGMASEETLKKLVKSITDANKVAKEQLKETKAANKPENKAKAGAGANGTDKLGKAAEDATDNIKGWARAGVELEKSFKNLGLTALAVAAKFMTNYAEMANDPIKAGAELINTSIDVVTDFTTGLTKAIPVVGDFLAGLEKATAELLKAANATFADQLEKNVKALQDYAKSGVSFAGGMAEMQLAAAKAGLGIKDFADVISKNKEELNQLGLAGGEAAEKLAGAMGVAADKSKALGKSGASLRDEMFKMGYAYEDQGAIFTSFMANMQAAGKLRAMTDKEIAEGTRQYAKDLKVVADFTGQDAKKLAERGRQQQLLLIAQQKLTGDQNVRLGQATQALGRMGSGAEKARQAVTQLLINGATNVQGYTMGPLRKMAEQIAADIKSGHRSGIDSVSDAMASAQEASIKDRQQGAIVNAQLMNAAGDAAGALADSQAALWEHGKVVRGQTEQSSKDAETMADSQSDLSKQTAALYSTTKDFQVIMETKVNKNLGSYADILERVNKASTTMFEKFLGGGGTGGKEGGGQTNGAVRTGRGNVVQGYHYDSIEAAAKDGFEPVYSGGVRGGKGALSGWRKAGKQYSAYDKGGAIGANQVGIAGENGPELISGPNSVLSTASTESLIKALDAMREMKGVRFGESGIDTKVSMNADRLAKLKERSAGFEGLDYKQLEAELDRRPEQAPINAVKDQWDAEERGDSSNNTAGLLNQLVTLMKQNVAHTAKVALNTN